MAGVRVNFDFPDLSACLALGYVLTINVPR